MPPIFPKRQKNRTEDFSPDFSALGISHSFFVYFSETSHNYLSDFYSTFDSPHQSAADPDPDGDGAYAYYPVEPYHYGYQHHQPQGLFGAIDRQSFADDPVRGMPCIADFGCLCTMLFSSWKS